MFILGALSIVTLLLGPGAITPSNRPRGIPILPRSVTLLAVAFLLLSLVAAIAVFISSVISNREKSDRDTILRRRALIRLVFTIAISFFLVYVGMAFILSTLRIPDESEPPEVTGAGEIAVVDAAHEESPETQRLSLTASATTESNQNKFVPIFSLIAGSVATLVVAIIGARRLRNAPGKTKGMEAEMEDELLPTARRVLDRLYEERDDRDAIIAAYGAVESSFEKHGIKRDPAITPRAFVEGVVTRFWPREGSTYESLVDISRLYEIAMFSDHQIVGVDRKRAIALMERLVVYLESRRVDDR